MECKTSVRNFRRPFTVERSYGMAVICLGAGLVTLAQLFA